ncbi:MAG: alkaline phosphatase PhoX [Solirubrobacteraceae bacterium]
MTTAPTAMPDPSGPAARAAPPAGIRRRTLLRGGVAAAVAAGFGPAFWRTATANAALARTGPGPYGPLGDPDGNGLRLPAGFTSRLIARSGQSVAGTGYVLPIFPDGQATYPTPEGGWIQVINSEVPLIGGASAIRYAPDGRIVSAYNILGGTSTNCAGGSTPWGTWLSCEEVDEGRVWECDPTGRTPAEVRPALGVFKHEAACVDPVHEHLYLTEDLSDGCLYRFTPDHYPDLSSGRLECAFVSDEGNVVWRPIDDPGATRTPTRKQQAGATRFARAEGIWYDAGTVYIATTGDETIHAYRTDERRIEVIYRHADTPESPLQGVDNITVSRSGDVFVCEDSYDNDPDAMDVCMITREGEVARFCKLTGAEHFMPGPLESEITGVSFSPDGTRMSFASQRAWGVGAVYEVRGPFRLDRPVEVAPPPPAAAALLGFTATRAIRAQTLLEDGMRVRLTSTGRIRTVTRLRARVRRGRRVRMVTLARDQRMLRGGSRTIRLRVRNRSVRRSLGDLRGTVTGHLETTVRRTGGRTVVERRTVRITASKRRRERTVRRRAAGRR